MKMIQVKEKLIKNWFLKELRKLIQIINQFKLIITHSEVILCYLNISLFYKYKTNGIIKINKNCKEYFSLLF
jgi:hypothetical protein